MPDMDEKIAIEDIQAEVSKTRARLVFSGIVLFMVLIGFCAKTCANMPPTPIVPEPSVECTKVGGQWFASDRKIVDGNVYVIEAYCSLKK